MKRISLTLLLVVAFSALDVQGAPNGTVDVKEILDTPEEAEGVRPPDDEQAKRIQQFHTEVAKIKNLNDSYYLHSKAFAEGLLKRNKWDVNKAVKKFKQLLVWRATNKIEQLGLADVDPELFKWFPYALKSQTRDGCPVLEVDPGKWQIADFMESKEFVRDAIHAFDEHTNQMWEKTRIAIRDSPNCIAGVALGVHDFRGWGAKTFAETNAMTACVRTALNWENRFPNILPKNYGTNSNRDVKKFMDAIRPFLGQTDFVTYLEEEPEKAKDVIRKYMDPENLTLKHFNP